MWVDMSDGRVALLALLKSAVWGINCDAPYSTWSSTTLMPFSAKLDIGGVHVAWLSRCPVPPLTCSEVK